MIEPKFPFRQFFDFRFGVNAIRFFNLPYPYPNAAQPARSSLSVAQPAAPIERALFLPARSLKGIRLREFLIGQGGGNVDPLQQRQLHS
jgi:hypothetical protein